MCVNRNDSASSFDNFDLLCFEVLILMVSSRGKLKSNLSCHCATVPRAQMPMHKAANLLGACPIVKDSLIQYLKRNQFETV